MAISAEHPSPDTFRKKPAGPSLHECNSYRTCVPGDTL